MKIFLTLFLTILVLSCTSAPEIKNAESEAEVQYKTGLYYLENEEYTESEHHFMKIISDFSYSAYEPLATIGLADTFFKREEYEAAIEVYKRFIKMRPTHKQSEYSLYQIANCYFMQKPSDFFALPSPEERDVVVVQKAVKYYSRYIDKYPSGKYVKKSKQDLAKCESILIKKELDVAEFYMRRDKCEGVISRVDYIKKHYKLTTPAVIEKIKGLEEKCAAK